MVAANFMLPASFLVLENDMVYIFVHLSMFTGNRVMELFQLVLLPVLVNGTDHQLEMSSSNRVFTVNQDQDAFTVIPASDVKDCQKIA